MNRLLLDLQEIDSALTRFKREKAALDNGDSARIQRDALQSQVNVTRAQLKAAETSRAERENQLSATEEKIARQQKRVMNVSSAHEIAALERDIEGLSRARGEHDEAILMLMDESETLSAQLVKLEADLKAAQAEVERIEADFAAQSKRLETSLENRGREREFVAQKLSPVEKAKYDASLARHQGVAVATVNKGNCSACGMTITPFALREAPTIPFPTCEACGRLLFVE